MKDRYPHPTSPAVTAVMRGNRSLDTKPEIAIRSLLHRSGYRFRKHRALLADGVRVRPDLVFGPATVAVFIDGCFWHGCPIHGRKPAVNQHYWEPKLERNLRRDERVTKALVESGWTVLRIWEHVSPNDAVAMIKACLQGRYRLGIKAPQRPPRAPTSARETEAVEERSTVNRTSRT